MHAMLNRVNVGNFELWVLEIFVILHTSPVLQFYDYANQKYPKINPKPWALAPTAPY